LISTEEARIHDHAERIFIACGPGQGDESEIGKMNEEAML
jgi:hypothetical protein